MHPSLRQVSDSDALRDGYVYTREFENCPVWLDLEDEKARIDWKDVQPYNSYYCISSGIAKLKSVWIQAEIFNNNL